MENDAVSVEHEWQLLHNVSTSDFFEIGEDYRLREKLDSLALMMIANLRRQAFGVIG